MTARGWRKGGGENVEAGKVGMVEKPSPPTWLSMRSQVRPWA